MFQDSLHVSAKAPFLSLPNHSNFVLPLNSYPLFFQHDPPPLSNSPTQTPFQSQTPASCLSWSFSILLASPALPITFFTLLLYSLILNPSLLFFKTLLFSPHPAMIQKKGSRKFHKQFKFPRPPYLSVLLFLYHLLEILGL